MKLYTIRDSDFDATPPPSSYPHPCTPTYTGSQSKETRRAVDVKLKKCNANSKPIGSFSLIFLSFTCDIWVPKNPRTNIYLGNYCR